MAGIEKDFNAVVDILGERVVSFEGDSGEILKYHDVPTAFEGDLITRRTELIECLSNVDDEIGERYGIYSSTSTSWQRRGLRKVPCSDLD